jgi:hypothetical protein
MLELKKSRASIRSIRSSDTRNDSIRSQNPSYQQRKSPLEREDDLTLRREASPERERDTRRAAGAELVRASSLRFLFFFGTDFICRDAADGPRAPGSLLGCEGRAACDFLWAELRGLPNHSAADIPHGFRSVLI